MEFTQPYAKLVAHMNDLDKFLFALHISLNDVCASIIFHRVVVDWCGRMSKLEISTEKNFFFVLFLSLSSEGKEFPDERLCKLYV